MTVRKGSVVTGGNVDISLDFRNGWWHFA